MITQDFWVPRWRRIEQEYIDIVRTIQERKPETRTTLEHRTGDGFHAFSTFCSVLLSNRGDDIDCIVISLGFMRKQGELRVETGITYSDGSPIADGPITRTSESDLDGPWIDGHVEDSLKVYQIAGGSRYIPTGLTVDPNLER